MTAKKIVFLFGGTPHYYNAILNRLHRLPGYSVAVVSPTCRSRTFGEGVHESTDGIEFEHFQLEETQNADGSLAFAGLAEFLNKFRPAIIVSVLPYLDDLYHNEEVIRAIQKNQIKIILKDHPFRLKTYESAERSLRYAHGILSSPKAVGLIKQLRRRGLPRACVMPIAFAVAARNRWQLRDRTAEQLRRLKRDAHLFRSPDALVCYVDEAFDIFGSYGVPRERIFITRNSPDTEKWFAAEAKILSSSRVQRVPHRILHIGRLVQWKRVDLLLRAFKLVLEAYSDAEVDVVGYGPQENEWKALATDLGISSRITFSGGVYGEERLAQHFIKASVYVLAGMGGLSINDAMCFSLPIICSVCDGTEKHLVYDGVNGRYFREGDAIDLARKIIEMFRNPQAMLRMGQKSREIIESKVNERTVISGYERAFAYVLTRSV